MINPIHAVLTVAVSAAVTILLRFLPFLVFRGHRKTPAVVSYFGKVLPYATMAMLVVFCLKDLNLLPFPHGLPELISCGVVVLLHAWRHNTLLSIILGTACYMILIQSVFA